MTMLEMLEKLDTNTPIFYLNHNRGGYGEVANAIIKQIKKERERSIQIEIKIKGTPSLTWVKPNNIMLCGG